jgi:hypothetical protein
LKEIVLQFCTLSHVTCKRCTETKECSFHHGLLKKYNLAKQMVMTDKSLRSFSVFVSVAVKHFTGSDGINVMKEYIISVCILDLVIRHAKRIFSASYYVVTCGLSVCTIFLHIIS